MTVQALKDLSRAVCFLFFGFFFWGRGRVEICFGGLFFLTSIKLLMVCPDNMQATKKHAIPQPGERGCWK